MFVRWLTTAARDPSKTFELRWPRRHDQRVFTGRPLPRFCIEDINCRIGGFNPVPGHHFCAVLSDSSELCSRLAISNQQLNFGKNASALSCQFRELSRNACVCYASFKLVQIGVACRMAQRTTHSDHLAFVMEGVGQDMMQNQCGCADRNISIWEMKFRIGVDLLIRKGGQIRVRSRGDLLQQATRICDRRKLIRRPVDVPRALERLDPEPFAITNVNHLVAQRGKSEVRKFFRIIARGDCGHMVQHHIQAGMGPVMKLSNAFDSE